MILFGVNIRPKNKKFKVEETGAIENLKNLADEVKSGPRTLLL